MISEIFHKIFSWLWRPILGLLLPLYLFYTLFAGYYGIQRQDAVAAALEAIDLQIDILEKFHADQTFFHALLQKNFVRADRSASPAASLTATIALFRRVYAGKIKFVVWDSKGVINKSLSDEQRFQFVLKTMFNVLHTLNQAYISDHYVNPSGIAQISEKINLLRGYFGPFLFENLLFEPLRPDHLGKCIFVNPEADKRLLWYYPGSNFSLACFIDAALTGNCIGPAMISRRVNRDNPDQKLAFIKTISYAAGGLPESPQEQSEIKLETRKFENNGASPRQSANFLINLRQVSPDLIVLGYQNKNSLPDPQKLATAMLFSLVRCLLVISFVLYCYSLRLQQWCLSVHQKMLLLFVFSNGLPVLLMLSTGFEFFNEKRNHLINSTQQESLRLLKEFDVRFPEVASSLAEKLNAFIDQKNAEYGAERWSEADIAALENLLSDIKPQEGGLLEVAGNYRFYIADNYHPAAKMGQDLMRFALDFFNADKPAAKQRVRVTMLDQVSSNDRALYFFLAGLNRFSMLSSGNSERVAYMKFTGDSSQGKIWGMLGLSWERAAFLRAFIGERLKSVAAEVSPRLLAVMDKESEIIISPQPIENLQINRLLRQTKSRKMLARDNVELAGRRYLFTAIAGNEISEGILVSLFPQEIIEKKIVNLKILISAVFFLVLFVLWNIVKLFSQRLLAPVGALAAGIEKVRNLDYSCQVEVQGADELGQLVMAFNQTVEGLQELAIGTTVQVSLLPPGKYRRGKVNLFAKSLFMSKMGGDYFDYFDLPDNRLGIFFGDVAGHGIPAAMIMAMIKALVTAVSQNFPGPSEVLFRGSCVLQELKKRNWKRMMTAQCLELDCDSGAFKIASAGHCYPIIVSAGGCKTVQLELIGFPLGSSSKKKPEEFQGSLMPGDTLILYTDGIIEATDAAGEMFGYPRFHQLLQTAWNEDLATYWQQIHAAYNVWATVQDDDLTFMLVRFGEKPDA